MWNWLELMSAAPESRKCDRRHLGVYWNKYVIATAVGLWQWINLATWEQAPVALSCEEMRTPYASGREICVQRFGSALPTKINRETNDAFQTHLHNRVHQTIQGNNSFANDARFPFTIMLAYLPWSFASRVLWDVLRPSPAFCVRCTYCVHDVAYMLELYAYYTQKCALTRPLYKGVYTVRMQNTLDSHIRSIV